MNTNDDLLNNVANQIGGEEVTRMVRMLSECTPDTADVIADPMETCACGKLVPISDLEELDTGVFKTLNNICKNCTCGKNLDKVMARLVCAKCKRVLMRIEPQKDKISGFEFKADKTYHTKECDMCTPGITKTPIIEKTIWNQAKHSN